MWARGACSPPLSFEISHPTSPITDKPDNPPVTPHPQCTPEVSANRHYLQPRPVEEALVQGVIVC